MSSKTPGQRPFLSERPGVENPLIYLHTAEVTGSNPVAPTSEALVRTGVSARSDAAPVPGWEHWGRGGGVGRHEEDAGMEDARRTCSEFCWRLCARRLCRATWDRWAGLVPCSLDSQRGLDFRSASHWLRHMGERTVGARRHPCWRLVGKATPHWRHRQRLAVTEPWVSKWSSSTTSRHPSRPTGKSDLGPDRGNDGGEIVFTGTPENWSPQRAL